MKKLLLFILLWYPIISNANNPIFIGIIIDDMGNHQTLDSAVVNLPAPVTCSIIPYTYFSVEIANKAHAVNKEIIAHIPMQAIGGESLGRGGLTIHLSQEQFIQTLMNDLSAVPYAEGLNNHMGSYLTEQTIPMTWLMQTIQPTGLFFVDSRTSAHTVAEKIAIIYHVPTLQRDVFLDDQPNEVAIAQQFARLIALARKQGMAVAIGHPYPATVSYLQKELPLLSQQGVEVVPLSQLISDREYVQQLTAPE